MSPAVPATAPAPRLLADAGGTIAAVSGAIAPVFAGASGELIGKGLTEVFAVPADAVRSFLRDCVRSDGVVRARFPLRSGGDCEVEGCAADSARGETAGQIAIVLHPPRLVQPEPSPHHADDFLVAISHELRTPLTIMLGWLDLMSAGLVDAREMPEVIGTLRRAARRQMQLVDDVLDVANHLRGKPRLCMTPINPATVVEGALAAIRPAAETKQVDLFVSISYRAGRVSADPDRLHQAVWNLLANAVKFSAKGGKIYVSLKRKGSVVVIKVTDEGEGIAPEFQPHLFERFHQEDAGRARQHGGLGLGLALVRDVIELHGGQVAAASAGKGRGATFTIELPLLAIDIAASQEPERAGDAPQPLAPECLRDKTVLVVDDEKDACLLVTQVLRRHGATVRNAGSAEAALAILEEERVDVLVSDIGMPYQSGLDLIRAVRALDERLGRYTPAVALTALTAREDRARCLASGFQDHVPKPVRFDELVGAITRVLRRRTRPQRSAAAFAPVASRP